MSKMKNMRTVLLFLIVAMITLGVSAQTVTVKGTVTDKTGETVIGASVVEKGNTGNGTITDIDGNFSLSVPTNATLVFSYVGMTTQEIAVKGQQTINVVLSDDAQALEEVVVIGYGSVKKKDLTGSVATVNSETLAGCRTRCFRYRSFAGKNGRCTNHYNRRFARCRNENPRTRRRFYHRR